MTTLSDRRVPEIRIDKSHGTPFSNTDQPDLHNPNEIFVGRVVFSSDYGHRPNVGSCFPGSVQHSVQLLHVFAAVASAGSPSPCGQGDRWGTGKSGKDNDQFHSHIFADRWPSGLGLGDYRLVPLSA